MYESNLISVAKLALEVIHEVYGIERITVSDMVKPINYPTLESTIDNLYVQSL